MPQNKIHEELSRKRTGKSFADLHDWMCGPELTREEYEQRHRIVNILDNLPYVRERWGESGVQEYFYHFQDDFDLHKAVRLTKFLMKLPLFGMILRFIAAIYSRLVYRFF